MAKSCNHLAPERLYREGMSLRQRFNEHPASVGESYFEHFKVATHFARELFGAAFACAIHAAVPSMHQTTASTKVKALCDEMTAGKRGAATAEAVPAPALTA